MAIKKGGAPGQADLILDIILAVVVIGILGVYFLRQYRVWKTKEQKTNWPLNVSPCPDYWEHKKNGGCKIKDNGNAVNWPVESNLKKCSITYNNKIYSSNFSGKSDVLKCEIAKKCGLAWDGINDKC